jgi:hypothetical protein
MACGGCGAIVAGTQAIDFQIVGPDGEDYHEQATIDGLDVDLGRWPSFHEARVQVDRLGDGYHVDTRQVRVS